MNFEINQFFLYGKLLSRRYDLKFWGKIAPLEYFRISSRPHFSSDPSEIVTQKDFKVNFFVTAEEKSCHTKSPNHINELTYQIATVLIRYNMISNKDFFCSIWIYMNVWKNTIIWLIMNQNNSSCLSIRKQNNKSTFKTICTIIHAFRYMKIIWYLFKWFYLIYLVVTLWSILLPLIVRWKSLSKLKLPSWPESSTLALLPNIRCYWSFH